MNAALAVVKTGSYCKVVDNVDAAVWSVSSEVDNLSSLKEEL